jgi:HEAT repeat protein
MPLFGPPDTEKLKAKGNVRGLIRAVRDRKDARRRRTAAVALGELGDCRAVEPLIQVLHDDDWDLGRAAAEALGRLGDHRAVGPLVTALGSPELNVRRYAAEALGRIGDADAVEPLVGALKDDDEILRTEAAEALGRIGDRRAVEPLVASLSSGVAGERRAAAGALKAIGDRRSVWPLTESLQDSSPAVRRAAAGALAELGDAQCVEPLVRRLEDQDGSVREAASAALRKLGWVPGGTTAGASHLIAQQDWDGCVAMGSEAVEPLIAALEDERTTVRQKAAWALGKIGDGRAAPALVGALHDRDKDVRQSARWALQQMGPSALEALVAGLLGSTRAASLEAARLLKGLGYQVDGLHKQWAAKGRWDLCVQIGPAAVQPLADALGNQDWKARSAAAKALGEIGDERGVRPLTQALTDSEWSVRFAAARALEKLGWQPDRGRAGACYWIAKGDYAKCVEIGASAIEPLIAALGSSEDLPRARAAKALVEISRSGRLTDLQKQRILAYRQRIRASQTHIDWDSGSCHHDVGIRIDPRF